MEIFLTEAVNTYERSLKNNHGITSKDQDKLLIPIGINLKVEDISLSESLNSYGEKRGDLAHKFQPHVEDTLSDIDSRLKQIISGLENLDKAICDLQ